MHKILMALLISGSFVSCKSLFYFVNGANKDLSFKDVNDYLNYIVPKYVLNKNNVYFPAREDEMNVQSFVVKSKIAYYYGSFIEQTKRFQKSAFFRADESCSGRVDNEILNPPSTTVGDSLFLKFRIINAVSKKRCIPKRNKDNIVFFFSTQEGNFNRKDLIKIQKRYRDTTKYNLIFISLDKMEIGQG